MIGPLILAVSSDSRRLAFTSSQAALWLEHLPTGW